MFEVGVNVPVQVMPSPDVSVLSVPCSTVTSLLSKAVTASENAIVTVEVSPIFRALSLIVTDTVVGALVSTSNVPLVTAAVPLLATTDQHSTSLNSSH